MVGVSGTANYCLMAQLPTANFCNWAVDSSNLPCSEGNSADMISTGKYGNMNFEIKIACLSQVT